jgi:tetratricopeptide (TPR) repeat protein
VLPLGGLQGEERWEYCTAILGDLGLRVDRNDADLIKLMELLDGHPLAMRVILPRLAERPTAQLVAALRSNLAVLAPTESEAQARLYATLRFAAEALPAELRPLLIPLALHEGFVVLDHLEAMAKQVDPPWTRAQINSLAKALVVAGLSRDRGQAIYEIHPVLTGFLCSTTLPMIASGSRDDWARAFVEIMGQVASVWAPRPLHEQRSAFFVNGANFHQAVGEAERLGIDLPFAALTEALARYAQNISNYEAAARLFERLADHSRTLRHHESEAAALHQLGTIAVERRDFAAAEQWYRKALAISEKLGIEHGAARTYHQLGIIATERREFAAAEHWYRKTLAIWEKLGNEHDAASTYHQLGITAQERRDFAAAEQCYRKALAIKEKLGNEHSAASTYHQRGKIAAERRDFAAAEQWSRKALAIWEKLGNEHDAASTYDLLGRIAAERRDFAAAEQWYRKALAIKEKLGNEHGAASTYHQLGRTAEEQRDFAAAEQWYRKSLAIKEKLGNEHGAATTNGQLGILAGMQRSFVESGRWFIKCIHAFIRVNDPHRAGRSADNFLFSYRAASPADQAQLKVMWEEAGLGPFPESEAKGPTAT